MRQKNKWVKIMAFLALFWIIIWIIWTWVLVILNNNTATTTDKTISPEQYLELQKLIEAQSWETINTKTLTWETK